MCNIQMKFKNKMKISICYFEFKNHRYFFGVTYHCLFTFTYLSKDIMENVNMICLIHFIKILMKNKQLYSIKCLCYVKWSLNYNP